VINIQIDPSKIDINVHPTKQEIKFEDERVLYAFLNSACKKSLGAFNITPSIDFGQESAINDRFANDNTFPISTPSMDNRSFSEARSASSSPVSEPSYAVSDRPKTDDWKSLYEISRNEASSQEMINTEVQATINPEWDATDDLKETETVPYQIHQSYILSHIKSGFLIIDQESCHERIKYEYYINSIKMQKANTQQLLFPEPIESAKSDIALLNEILPELKKLGFAIETSNEGEFTMTGIPADLSNLDHQKVIDNLLEQYKHFNTEFKLSKRENIALSLAKFSGIKMGKKLKTEEMKELLDQLFACENPNFSPSGKPIFVTYGLEDLNKHFQR
jgi:DNA mismatch repair protein MutL